MHPGGRHWDQSWKRRVLEQQGWEPQLKTHQHHPFPSLCETSWQKEPLSRLAEQWAAVADQPPWVPRQHGGLWPMPGSGY
ncbi:hypothetical protein SESBI_02673 [Sesbania bispinosa]|nr:hypothetical protein SESBI_02673 [Sesbania bispinosa]